MVPFMLFYALFLSRYVSSQRETYPDEDMMPTVLLCTLGIMGLLYLGAALW